MSQLRILHRSVWVYGMLLFGSSCSSVSGSGELPDSASSARQESEPAWASQAGAASLSSTDTTQHATRSRYSASDTPDYPLRISDNKRYLVDQTGRPFLINQASSWGLIQSLSTEGATQYIDSLAARGINTLMVSVISNDKRMPGTPPQWQGIDPFLVHWDFSQPNEAYFEHADEILEIVRSRNMLVELVPSYLGYHGDATQGWRDEIVNANNSVDKSRAYGRFLGKRYKHVDNVIWLAGGDDGSPPGSALEQHMRAIIEGIKEEDPEHLWSGHWDGTLIGGAVASEHPSLGKYMDLNGYYAFDYSTPYLKDLEWYARQPTKPLYHMDMSYETEWGGDPASIRRRAYSGMLSGASGSSFCGGPDWYLFRPSRNMDSVGMKETQYWYKFFVSRPWYQLVPDTDHKALTAGYRTLGDVNYVTAARTEDGRLIAAYLPAGGTVSIALGQLQAQRAHAFWYDPTRGVATTAQEVVPQGSQTFTAPSEESWLLVIEDATAGWDPL